MAKAKTKAVAETAPAAPVAKVVAGATSGVMAPGPVGKAARQAAAASLTPTPTAWRAPDASYADDDTSIDARMWRLSKARG